MSFILSYTQFINESNSVYESVNKEVEKLEDLLKLPKNSGVFQTVSYDSTNKVLTIEQPNDLNPMDAGAVMAAINKEKPRIKKNYTGIKNISIGDLQITL